MFCINYNEYQYPWRVATEKDSGKKTKQEHYIDAKNVL